MQEKSITTSDSATEHSYFFAKLNDWQPLIELLVACNGLALALSIARSEHLTQLQGLSVIEHMLFLNWLLFSFLVVFDWAEPLLTRLKRAELFWAGFVLLELLVIFTTIGANSLYLMVIKLPTELWTWALVLNNVAIHTTLGILLGGMFFRYMWMREQWVEQQHSELTARIQSLQSRIHPHFLFNSLNSVMSLIVTDPVRAEHILLNLSKLFRASLQELKETSLLEEINLCQRYIEIEKTRLGDRLHVEWKIPDNEQLSTVNIPLLSLQPLIENSIYHGVEKISKSSRISILVEINDLDVNIVITNPYHPDKMHERKGSGIALNNVKQRLRAYYGNSVKLQTYAGGQLHTTLVYYRYKSK